MTAFRNHYSLYMETFTIDQCADFLNIHVSTALALAGKGKIKGAKIGRAWAFIKSDVEEYLRSCVAAHQEELSAKTIQSTAELRSKAAKTVMVVVPRRGKVIDWKRLGV